MEDNKNAASVPSTDFLSSSPLKYENLIDIPLTTKIIDSLVNLFNYLDIYGPKMPLVYNLVSIFRFFQLVGGSFMAANPIAFQPGTLTYKATSTITVLFHLIPVEFRLGKAFMLQITVDCFLIFMALYLIFTAFRYKSTSKVPAISIWLLSIFMAAGPFLLLPLIAQYAAQTTSALIIASFVRTPTNIFIVILTILTTLLWLWIIISSYTKAIVFRPCSLSSVQGTPQTRLIITTTAVTFATGLTTYFDSKYSTACLIISFFLYIYCSTTVFRCGTFIRELHQVMVLAGSFIGMVLCLGNLYPLFKLKPWEPHVFIVVVIIFAIAFISSYFFIKNRQRRELKLLDEIDETEDITIITPNKFKQMTITGFTFCHPLCLSFKFFKLAIQEWSNNIDIHCLYTKFLAIYPEQESQLSMVCQYIATMRNTNKILQRSTLASAAHILKNRESNLTPDLKNEISKIQKRFIRAKNKLRNVWDLILQGNTNEMNQAIKQTKPVIEECGVEISFLLMKYPNNRFVARQNVSYLNDIKCDPIEAKAAVENLKKLNRGLKIFPDTIHLLGIDAFPNLPEVCSINTQISTDCQTLDSENYCTEDILNDDSVNIEAMETINKQIANHKVPAIRFVIWSTIICFLVLVAVPLIGFLIYFQFFKNEIEEPVIITEGISKTEITFMVLAGYIGRVFFTHLNDPKHPGNHIMKNLYFDYPFDFKAFGGNSNSLDILKFATSQIPKSNAAIARISDFKPDNPYMREIRKSLLSSTVNFTLYFSRNNFTRKLSSVTDITYMLANHISKIYEWKEFTPENVKNVDSLTSRHNNDGSIRALDYSLRMMFEYFDDLKTVYVLAFFIVAIVLCAISIVVYASVYTAQIRKIRKNRQEILFILTTLPKTMISNISASFSKLSKGDTGKSEVDADVNRQEESIVKLFGTVSDGSSHANAEFVFLIFTILLVIFTCFGYYAIMNGYIETTETVVGKSSHINNLFGCAAYLYNVMASLFKIALATYDDVFEASIINLNVEKKNYNKRIPIILEYFNELTFGNEEHGPFDGIREVIAYSTAAIVCHDAFKPPDTFLSSVHCFSAPQQLHLTIALMKKYGDEMTQDPPIYPDPSDPILSRLWQVGTIELYETFFYKAGNEVVTLIFSKITEQNMKLLKSVIFFFCVNSIFVVIIIIAAKVENDFLKFCLRLYLRCPPMTILSNHRVMNLLSGNYSTKTDDVNERHSTYYDEVVNKLDVIVIVASDETRQILNVNNAFVKTFGVDKERAEKLTFCDFMALARFESDDDVTKIFSGVVDVKYTDSNGDAAYLQFSSVLVSGRRIIYAANHTQNVLHEKLIVEEKQKSDQMLSSILPPSMVPRVQAGEKNISFAVQSVTVLFLDIVSFTPWCGSHDAQYVMRMLNIMFKKLDALTAMHKTMTKIKCIGDCYMAAGGIFDEVNQPAVHAKEVVDFGRGAIQTILDIDEQENEQLQIRVGVNTGGPIVAGVIGTEKPTFEILGPAINIAHEMEHHGVPMKVHISRPVYELVYGQSFDIKERGEIDVKGGKMFTYLIDP